MVYPLGFNLIATIFLWLISCCLQAQSSREQSGFSPLKADEVKQITSLQQSAESNMQRNPALALRHAKTALKISQKKGYPYGIAKSSFLLGRIYGGQLQDFNTSIQYHKESIAATHKDSIEMLARNYFYVGKMYYDLGLYATSLSQFMASLRLYKQKHDIVNESIVKVHIASIYSEWGGISYDTAMTSYHSVLRLADKNQNDPLLVYTLYFYTTSLIEHQNFTLAEELLKRALPIVEDNEKYNEFAHRFYANMGEVLLHKREVERAIAFLERSKSESYRNNIRHGEAWALMKMGKAYFQMHEIYKAEHHYQSALTIYKRLNMKKKMVEVYGELASVSGASNNFESAFYYKSIQMVYEDSVCEDQKRSLVREVNTKAEELSNEKQLLIQRKNEQINELYITLLIIVITTSIFLGLLYLNHQRLRTAKERSTFANERVLLQQQLETQKLEEEQLKQKLEFNAKTLTANTLNLIQKNEILEKIKTKAEDIRKASPVDLPSKINNLMQTVNFALNVDKDWENFKIHFEQVHNNFFDHLKSKFPDLNSNDLKLCALLKLNLDTKQIATVMDISPESVKVARSRLRKKLQLDPSENLSSFITHV